MSQVLAWTDGANMPHHEFKHAGSAAVVQLPADGGIKVLEWGRYLGHATNNVAELSGIEQAVVLANRYAPGMPLAVHTDSQYCQGVLTFLRDKEKWAYRAKKNRELIERIRRTLPAGDLWEIRWVKGHDGNRLNERADRIAVWCKEKQRDWVCEYWENAGAPLLE